MKPKILAIALIGVSVFTAHGASPVVSFTVDPTFVPTKIPPYFFGVGREQLNMNVPRENPEQMESRVKILKDLKFKVLRGPSGTPSNFFLWKKGYFFTSAEPDYEKYYEKNKEKVQHRANGVGSRPVLLPELYEESIALGVPYVFNVNVVSQTAEDIADMVKEIKKISSKPIFLEMGNELFEPSEEKVFPLCKNYVEKVRAIKKAVNAVDPTVKIGVVCPSYPFSRKRLLKSGLRSIAKLGNRPIDRYLEWDEVLAANQDAFDAVILHPYVFFSLENARPESLMAYMFAWNAAGEEVIREDFVKLFPGKKIWMTEFNVLTWDLFNEKDKSFKNRIQTMKTPGTAIVNMETLLTFIDAGNVDIATLHTFVDGQGFGIISRAGKDYDQLPNYHVFAALGNLIDKYPFYYRLANSGGTTTEMWMSYKHVEQGPELALIKFENVGAWGFGDAKGLRQVILLNRTTETATVELSNKKFKKLWTYGGRQVMPEFLNYSREWTAPPQVNPVPDVTVGVDSTRIELPPYSVTIAELPPEK
ncbi:MAG: hypothetical protein B9S32_17205 [Verrucomicrobia bacterium Tous-C9LFEB]|nr:MAG: hypothetical protein B9S32_17205 [Verrucomicrobia bacterium Tous-C9LFEB]